MRPSSGTGHSTSPATSASSPRSGPPPAPHPRRGRRCRPSMIRSRSAASATTKRARSPRSYSAKDRTAKGRSRPARDGPPSGRRRPGHARRPRHAPARSAPACRRGHIGCAPAAAPRRSRWCPSAWISARRKRAAGRAAARRSAPRPPSPAPGFCSTQNWPSWVSCSRAAPCLRRNPSSAASGAPVRGPRSSLPGVSARAAISPTAAIRRGPYSGRGACVISGASAFSRAAHSSSAAWRLHARRDFLGEELDQQPRTWG